ncbi:hypothetical protein LENED_004230 [Lentinula edodes]|uniref:Uncharacterized protein n=1 Tax=Lentinula edodes TaxID=5353 RepID=A0A1Q3E5M2_LENED|nr:hypothetical protein LENED_004230 [Lentinula edodes]
MTIYLQPQPISEPIQPSRSPPAKASLISPASTTTTLLHILHILHIHYRRRTFRRRVCAGKNLERRRR